jgi:arabinogalactan endo-1,4-beta-galactosidase
MNRHRFFLRLSYTIAIQIFLIFNTHSQELAVGADLSFLKQAEDSGFSFKEDGKAVPGLQLFKNHGYNWIRLRLFHAPDRLPNNLEYTIALAKAAKALGYKFLLNYHYSDTWADPGKQFLPKAWEGKTQEELVTAIHEYTLETMKVFRDSGAMPDMVQVGNEISNGMMWPFGKLPDNWDNFAALEQAGINGVFAACGNLPRPKIMVHIDKGGDWAFTKAWFDKFMSYGIDFDVIGQSYYPWWHGTLFDLKYTLYQTAFHYQKPIWMVEVAYCSQPTEYKEKPGPFPETPEGQRQFLEEVTRMVLNTPGNLGTGVFWWEPATRGGRSARDFFDEAGNVLPVIQTFDKYTRK